MAGCVTPASAEIRSGPQCSAGFGPGTKPDFGCLGFLLASSLHICHCCTSCISVSCSTVGLYKQRHSLVYSAFLGKKACPMVIVNVILCLALITFLFFLFSFFWLHLFSPTQKWLPLNNKIQIVLQVVVHTFAPMMFKFNVSN